MHCIMVRRLTGSRTVVWTGIDHFSTELVSIERDDHQWRFEGRIITAFDERPAFISYAIICDATWRTRHASASCQSGNEVRTITLDHEDDGWSVNGVLHPELVDCRDVDLEVTPLTNSLPINRLKLPVGASAKVNAAWLRFPMLSVEPLEQRYVRIGAHTYRYEAGPSFQATLDVDHDGIVTRYEDGWERVYRFRT